MQDGGLVRKAPDPHVFHDLLDRAAKSIGNIYMYEDYLPEDPRDDVRIRISDYTLRIGPGDIERPVADIDRALMVSKAIDPLLIDRAGVGYAAAISTFAGVMEAAVSKTVSNDGAAGG